MSTQRFLPNALAPIAGGMPADPEYWKFFKAVAEATGASDEQVAELIALINGLDLGSLEGLAKAQGVGIAVKIPGAWVFRRINGAQGRIVVDTGDAVSSNPLVDLAILEDSLVGAALVKITRDIWGRVEGTEAATTDDLAEGVTNLYFTVERAQDAVGNAVDGTGDVPLSYDDATGAIRAELASTIAAALTFTGLHRIDGQTKFFLRGAFDARAVWERSDGSLATLMRSDYANGQFHITQYDTDGVTPLGDLVFGTGGLVYDGDPVLSGDFTPIVAYGAGAPYVLTATPAAVDMGTSDPAIVIDAPGTYLLRGYVQLDQAAGTVVAETVDVNYRRTNNTPADLADGSLTFAPLPTTAVTYTAGVLQLPELVYTTANSDDAITIFISLSAALGAGDLQVSSAQIIAQRIS